MGLRGAGGYAILTVVQLHTASDPGRGAGRKVPVGFGDEESGGKTATGGR